MFRVGDKVILRRDVLQRHARSIPAHVGYTPEQFQWRKTLGRLLGLDDNFKQVGPPLVGTVSRLFEDSKHVNVEFADGTCIGIASTELQPG